MADSWSGNPATFATGEVVTAAKLNAEIRDRMDALRALGNGDTSADTDMRHAHKNGTLAARPAAGSAIAGQFYFATDRNTLYIHDGTVWRHAGGRGAYDTFTRGNSTTIGSAESGHPWVEASGDLEINSNALRLVSGTGIATVDTGAELETARFQAAFTSGAAAASVDLDVVLRYLDGSNFLYAQLIGASNLFRLMKVVATVHTQLVSVAVAVSGGAQYIMQVDMVGGSVLCQLFSAGTQINTIIWGAPADTFTPFAGATKCGLRMTYVAQDKCEEFACVPNT